MIRFKHILIYLPLIFVFFVSCSEVKESDEYSVNLKVEGLHIDSVTLYIYEPTYNKLRILCTGKLKNGVAQMQGQLDGPRVAVMKFREDDKPLYFILEQCVTEINVSKERIIIWGGKMNHEYLSLCKKTKLWVAKKEYLRKKYWKMLKDSTLNSKIEQYIIKTDSLYNDSIQKTTLKYSTRSDVIGWLFRDQHFNDLDTLHMRMLK